MTPERTRRGLWLIASGIGKKMILGDFVLAPFVADVFMSPGVANAPVHWLALYSFAFQIYFDFSGYTDMARGLACLLGYELPVNFLEPYLSRNPAEFWRRWHITLSSWLRDYLYVPLGGNRRGRVRTYLNLLATMLLGGLWHGAGWNFLVWGGIHGLLLVAHRAFAGRTPTQDAPLAWRDAPKLVVCFHAVILPWVFFRAARLRGRDRLPRGPVHERMGAVAGASDARRRRVHRTPRARALGAPAPAAAARGARRRPHRRARRRPRVRNPAGVRDRRQRNGRRVHLFPVLMIRLAARAADGACRVASSGCGCS